MPKFINWIVCGVGVVAILTFPRFARVDVASGNEMILGQFNLKTRWAYPHRYLRLVNPRNLWSVVVEVEQDHDMTQSSDILVDQSVAYALGLKKSGSRLRIEEVK